jgi:PAS domain S-box-containing protein
MQMAEAVDILLVDDRDDNLLVLEAILSSPQYRLVRARSGPEALRKIDEREFALILLDVQMPGMDGFETARRIRTGSRGADTPIIFVTAIGKDEEHAHRGYEMGAVDYIYKPLDVQVLRSKVAAFADLYRRTRRLREQEATSKKLYQLSETRFRAFFGQSSLPMGIFSLSGTCVEINVALQSLLGLSGGESAAYNLLGDPRFAGTPFLESVRRGFAGQASEVPAFVVRPSLSSPSHRLWIGAYIYPVKDDLGEVREVALIFKDVTAAVFARQQIEQSEERFRTLAESLPQMVWTASPDGSCVYFNSRWSEYLGASRAIGCDWLEAIHPDDSGNVTERFARSLRTGEPYELQYRLQRKDGKYRWFLARGLPIRDETGDIQRWIGTATDITEQMETQDKLKKAIQARDEFLSIASHELRTPVTSMVLNAQMLRRQLRKPGTPQPSPEQLMRVVEQAERSLDRLRRLIEEMLDLSRINLGSFKLKFAANDLVAVVADALEGLEPLLTTAGCTVTLEAPQRVTAVCDRYRIEQAFSNLVTNSLRYAPGKPIRVFVGTEGAAAVIRVTDEGIGIAPGDQNRIFERFERAVSANEVSGLGLGLYLSREILRAHGGSISLQSTPSQGSTFTLHWPADGHGVAAEPRAAG